MNIENLKRLREALDHVPAERRHDQTEYFHNEDVDEDGCFSSEFLRSEERESRCRTSACTAGHGALSGIPELHKRTGESWGDYLARVYDLDENTCSFLFAGGWGRDCIGWAQMRVECLLEHGKPPPRGEWYKFGNWKGSVSR